MRANSVDQLLFQILVPYQNATQIQLGEIGTSILDVIACSGEVSSEQKKTEGQPKKKVLVTKLTALKFKFKFPLGLAANTQRTQLVDTWKSKKDNRKWEYKDDLTEIREELVQQLFLTPEVSFTSTCRLESFSSLQLECFFLVHLLSLPSILFSFDCLADQNARQKKRMQRKRRLA